MSSVCYWFSGTGNSLYAAEHAAKAVEGLRLVPITKGLADNPPRIEGDLVGLSFPVYAYGPPAIVARFLANAEIGDVGYLFAVLTHGGGPANATQILNSLMTQRGLHLSAAFPIRMPSNYVTGSNPITGAKLSAVLAEGEEQLTAMRAVLKERQEKPLPNAGASDRFKTWAIHPLFMRGMKKVDRKFSCNSGCTGCGICVKVCPMENISLCEAQTPQWHGSCEYCLACIHACPEHAIQAGMFTQKRGRYRHPAIPLKRLLTRT